MSSDDKKMQDEISQKKTEQIIADLKKIEENNALVKINEKKNAADFERMLKDKELREKEAAAFDRQTKEHFVYRIELENIERAKLNYNVAKEAERLVPALTEPDFQRLKEIYITQQQYPEKQKQKEVERQLQSLEMENDSQKLKATIKRAVQEKIIPADELVHRFLESHRSNNTFAAERKALLEPQNKFFTDLSQVENAPLMSLYKSLNPQDSKQTKIIKNKQKITENEAAIKKDETLLASYEQDLGKLEEELLSIEIENLAIEKANKDSEKEHAQNIRLAVVKEKELIGKITALEAEKKNKQSELQSASKEATKLKAEGGAGKKPTTKVKPKANEEDEPIKEIEFEVKRLQKLLNPLLEVEKQIEQNQIAINHQVDKLDKLLEFVPNREKDPKAKEKVDAKEIFVILQYQARIINMWAEQGNMGYSDAHAAIPLTADQLYLIAIKAHELKLNRDPNKKSPQLKKFEEWMSLYQSNPAEFLKLKDREEVKTVIEWAYGLWVTNKSKIFGKVSKDMSTQGEVYGKLAVERQARNRQWDKQASYVRMQTPISIALLKQQLSFAEAQLADIKTKKINAEAARQQLTEKVLDDKIEQLEVRLNVLPSELSSLENQRKEARSIKPPVVKPLKDVRRIKDQMTSLQQKKAEVAKNQPVVKLKQENNRLANEIAKLETDLTPTPDLIGAKLDNLIAATRNGSRVEARLHERLLQLKEEQQAANDRIINAVLDESSITKTSPIWQSTRKSILADAAAKDANSQPEMRTLTGEKARQKLTAGLAALPKEEFGNIMQEFAGKKLESFDSNLSGQSARKNAVLRECQVMLDNIVNGRAEIAKLAKTGKKSNNIPADEVLEKLSAEEQSRVLAQIQIAKDLLNRANAKVVDKDKKITALNQMAEKILAIRINPFLNFISDFTSKIFAENQNLAVSSALNSGKVLDLSPHKDYLTKWQEELKQKLLQYYLAEDPVAKATILSEVKAQLQSLNSGMQEFLIVSFAEDNQGSIINDPSSKILREAVDFIAQEFQTFDTGKPTANQVAISDRIKHWQQQRKNFNAEQEKSEIAAKENESDWKFPIPKKTAKAFGVAINNSAEKLSELLLERFEGQLFEELIKFKDANQFNDYLNSWLQGLREMVLEYAQTPTDKVAEKMKQHIAAFPKVAASYLQDPKNDKVAEAIFVDFSDTMLKYIETNHARLKANPTKFLAAAMDEKAIADKLVEWLKMKAAELQKQKLMEAERKKITEAELNADYAGAEKAKSQLMFMQLDENVPEAYRRRIMELSDANIQLQELNAKLSENLKAIASPDRKRDEDNIKQLIKMQDEIAALSADLKAKTEEEQASLAEIATLKGSQRDNIDLEEFITELKSLLKDKEKELEAVKESADAAAREIEQLKADAKRETDTITAAQTKSNQALTEAKASADAIATQLKTETDQHALELESLKKKFANDLAQALADQEKELQTKFISQLEGVNSTAKTAGELAAKRISELQQELAAAKEAAEKNKTAGELEIERLRQTHAAEVLSLKEHNLEELAKQLAQQKEELSKKFAADLDSERNAAQSSIDALTSQNQILNTQLNSEKAKLLSEKERADANKKALDSQIEESTKALQAEEQKTIAEQERANDLQTKLTAASKATNTAEIALAEAQKLSLEAAAKLKEEESNHAAMLASLTAANAEKLRDELNKQEKTLTDKFSEDLAEVKRAAEEAGENARAIINSLKIAFEATQASLESQSNKHAAEIARLKTEHENEIKSITAQNKAALDKALEDQRTKLIDEFRAEARALEERFNREKEEIVRRFEAERNRAKALEEQLAQEKENAAAALAAALKAKEDAEAELSNKEFAQRQAALLDRRRQESRKQRAKLAEERERKRAAAAKKQAGARYRARHNHNEELDDTPALHWSGGIRRKVGRRPIRISIPHNPEPQPNPAYNVNAENEDVAADNPVVMNNVAEQQDAVAPLFGFDLIRKRAAKIGNKSQNKPEDVLSPFIDEGWVQFVAKMKTTIAKKASMQQEDEETLIALHKERMDAGSETDLDTWLANRQDKIALYKGWRVATTNDTANYQFQIQRAEPPDSNNYSTKARCFRNKEEETLEFVLEDLNPNDMTLLMTMEAVREAARRSGKWDMKMLDCEDDPAAAYKMYVLAREMKLIPHFENKSKKALDEYCRQHRLPPIVQPPPPAGPRPNNLHFMGPNPR